jgi:hypothetical protein
MYEEREYDCFEMEKDEFVNDNIIEEPDVEDCGFYDDSDVDMYEEYGEDFQ